MGVVNLMMSLIHECWHQRISCPGEVETYSAAINIFKSHMKSQCEQMAKDGICQNVIECKKAVELVLSTDQAQLEQEKTKV